MKDIETKDDPEFKFDDDDDDDSMLAAMLPDLVTKPTENPSSAVLGNPARSTQTDPNSSSQASQLPLQPHVNTDQSLGQSGHIPDASTAVQRLPPPTETNPNSSQASQVLVQPQVNTDQSLGQSGHIPDASTAVQRLPPPTETNPNSSQASQVLVHLRSILIKVQDKVDIHQQQVPVFKIYSVK